MQKLSLEKGQKIDLKKDDWSAISKIRVWLSWDVVEWKETDLDLFVVWKEVAYFWNKTAIKWVKLSDDNTTWKWEWDDEFANFDATQTDDWKYKICVNIFKAKERNQTLATIFNIVKDGSWKIISWEPKVTVYNQDTNEVLATFNLWDWGSNTWIYVWDVIDSWNTYQFEAVWNYVNWDINDIAESI